MIKDLVLGAVVLAFLGWLIIADSWQTCYRTDGCRIVDGVMVP